MKTTIKYIDQDGVEREYKPNSEYEAERYCETLDCEGLQYARIDHGKPRRRAAR